MSQTYAELYWKLDMKEGENVAYKMAKLRERKTRGFNQVKCIKDEADRLLVKNDKNRKDRENTSISYLTTRVRK
jgi:hypothetical protein